MKSLEPFARSIGHYSEVSKRPTSGARIDPGFARRLGELGCRVLLWEAFGARCDDADGRVQLYTSLVNGTEPDELPRPAARGRLPFRLRLIDALLATLGFQITCDPEDSSLCLSLRANLPLSWSSGALQSAKTIDETSHQPIAGGLFCPAIFGERSPSAGFEPKAEEFRFGHIDLPFALVTTTLNELQTDFPEQAAVSAVPVLPPLLRPMIPLPNGLWATSDLNDLYRRLFFAVERCRRLVSLNAPEDILHAAKMRLQSAYDALLTNAELDRPVVVEDTGRALRDVAQVLGDHLRTGERLVDFSGGAPAVVDDRLLPGQARVPRHVLVEMLRPLLLHRVHREGRAASLAGARAFLADSIHREDVDAWLVELGRDRPLLLANGSALAAATVGFHEAPALAIAPSDAERLRVRSSDSVAIHVPLGSTAVEEIRAIMADKPLPPLQFEATGWVADVIVALGDPKRLRATDVLLHAARSAARDRRRSLDAVLLVGGDL